MTDPDAIAPRRVETVDLPAGDYVSRGLWLVRPDEAFPHMRLGDPRQTTWPHMRRDVGHNWYVDERHPSVGFVNRDEASILYNNARLFVGRRCLEIGCWRGWSTAHLAAGCGGLEVIDPVLGDADWLSDVEGALTRAGVRDQVKLFPLASPQGVAELAARDPTPWSFIFIDGDHEGAGPRRDAETVIRFAAPDAMILLHDLLSPAVADALGFLRGQGWRTLIYNTAQVVGVAWRGDVQPVAHTADPSEVWRTPAHLESFLVSGESPEVRAERLGGVIRGLAEGDEHPGLGVDPAKVRSALEQLQAVTTRNQELLEDLTALRDHSKRLSDQIADLRAERDSYFAYYTSHNEAKAALAEREARLDRLQQEELAARETIVARVQTLEQELDRERRLREEAAAEGEAHQHLAAERGKLLDEALREVEQARLKAAADAAASADAVRERVRLKGLASALQGRLQQLAADRKDAEADARELVRLAAERSEHVSAALEAAREELSEQLDLMNQQTLARRKLEDQLKDLQDELETHRSSAKATDLLENQVRQLHEVRLADDADRLERERGELQTLAGAGERDRLFDAVRLNAELARTKAQLDRSNDQVAEFDSRIVAMEQEMAERIIQISWLEHEREQIAAERDKAKAELREDRPRPRSEMAPVRVADTDVERLSRAWAEAEVERDRFRAELQQAKEGLWSEVLASRAEVDSLRRENEAIRGSETWKMTAPLRALVQIARGSRPRR